MALHLLSHSVPQIKGKQMRGLVLYELKKIWTGKWKILPIVFLGIVLAWMAVEGATEYGPVRAVLDGRASRVNAETRLYWGQTVTQELHDLAVEKALAYGADMETVAHGELTVTRYSCSSLIRQYGGTSMEKALCNVWTDIANQPVDTEEKAALEEALQWEEEQYRAGKNTAGYMKNVYRKMNYVPWRVLPRSSAWDPWMNMEDYGSLLSGLAALLLILVFLSDLFSVEKTAGLGMVSASAKRKTGWLWAKLLAAVLTGALLMLILYGALLLFYGLLLGFQGWDLNPMWYRYGGNVMGMVYRDVPALAMAGLRLFVLMLCGSFFGVLVAALSALTKRAAPAVGLSVLAMGFMESLLYLSCGLRRYPWFEQWIENHDNTMWMTLLSTPMRMVFNAEILVREYTSLLSDFTMERNYNILCCPDLLAAYLGTLLAGIGILSWICLKAGQEGY